MMEVAMHQHLSTDVGFLLSRASGLVVRATNAALAEHGLRVRQYSVLTLAGEAERGVSQRELATLLGLDPSQVVLLVDELAAAGLVERRPSATDRRTNLVVATGRGRDVQERAALAAADALAGTLSRLDPAQCDLLRTLLAEVVAPAG
ncbi:MAG: Transcriptional regulator, MarR family [Modestobacter sp.]|jgi:DNA-binding MarR family transcriptional regulator|nr:Transcriptional regulator, MarR family [Modestobacter sp.]